MAITYNDLYTTARDWIVNNCTNISSFASINAAFKAGYRYTDTTTESKVHLNWTISGNQVTQSTADAVSTELTSVLNTYGITDLNAEVSTQRQMLNFYNALATFSSANIRLIGSSLNSNEYIIYVPSGTYENVSIQGGTDNVIYAIDGLAVSRDVVNVICSHIKGMEVAYSCTLSEGTLYEGDNYFD